MVEMQEANQAVLHATQNSLILFDESGRGTATYDGMALAQSIIEYVHDHVHAKTLFSTHYHELTALEDNLSELRNVHVGAVEKNGELVFLHQVENGPADKSYGIHVAKLAGMPEELLNRASDILSRLEEENQGKTISAVTEPRKQLKINEEAQEAEKPTTVNEDEQLSLFSEKSVDPKSEKVLTDLKTLNLMSLTPMDVMNLVNKWQQKLGK